MTDAPTPIVTEEPALPAIRRTGGMLERWIDSPTPEQAIAKLDTLSQVLEKLRKVAIQQTYPSDWVIHSTVDRDTGEVTIQVGYLQDSGAERAGKPFGIELGQPTERREDMSEDKTFVYHLEAPGWSKVTGEHIDRAVGSRWSGDDFFAKNLREGQKVDPSDVRKAAYANLHGRAVRSLTGLSAVPLESLREAGLDTTKCRFVGYQQGSRGGTSTGAQVGGAELRVSFGRSAGKTVQELDDKDLGWYLKTITVNVADESKAKFKKQNERLLEALQRETERRAANASHDAERGAAPATAADPGPVKGDDKPTARGPKVSSIWVRLNDIAGLSATALLRQVTKDLGTERAAMSELTDEELERLAGMGDEVLRKVWEQIKAAEGKKK